MARSVMFALGASALVDCWSAVPMYGFSCMVDSGCGTGPFDSSAQPDSPFTFSDAESPPSDASDESTDAADASDEPSEDAALPDAGDDAD